MKQDVMTKISIRRATVRVLIIMALLSLVFIDMTLDASSISVNGHGAIKSIAPGGYYTLALMNDGTVWGWGLNYFSTIGVDYRTLNNSVIPLQIQLPANVKDIRAGEAFALALMDDGTVWAWGDNTDGELGIGSKDLEHHPVPMQVQGLYNVKAISCGSQYALALTDDGTVWVWGRNDMGQQGDGQRVSSVDDVQGQVITIPVQVHGLDNVVAISAGSSNPAVVRSDGTVWAWGYNSSLAMRGENVLFPPTKIEGFNNIIDVCTDSGYVIALKNDGTVWSWGNNYNGCLGNSSAGSWTYNVFRVTGLNNIIAIDSGVTNCIALKDDGTVWTWGDNSMGEAGDGSSNKRPIPYMTSVRNIADIYAGNIQTSFAIDKEGTVWAWGGDEYGQLGDGSSGKEHDMNKTTPINELKITAPVIVYQINGPTTLPTATPSNVSAMPVSSISSAIPAPSGNESTVSAQGGLHAGWTLIPLTIVIAMALYNFIRKKD